MKVLRHAVKVNNFGVKPANCIATLALHSSADMFVVKYPVESEELKKQTYIDDELISAANKEEAIMKTSRMDMICDHAGMPNKGWTYSGDEGGDKVLIGGDGDVVEEKVLGLSWLPRDDTFKFHLAIQLSGDHKNGIERKIVSLKDLKENPPKVLTRRMVLSEISKIFDPIGFLVPVLLESKLLIRESWCGEKPIGWDEPLPREQIDCWLVFLRSLYELEDYKNYRSLWPQEDSEGLPILIVFLDGAKLAFGASAYIRWKIKGGYWTRLIMSKSKIAPKKIVSIPRMELNGALLGNRIKNFIVKETLMKFEVYHLLDSSAVLGYINKDCGKFKPYEGVRIAEIQSSNEISEGRLKGWAWVSGENNPSDWCTKPKTVKDLKASRFWDEGPKFVLQDEENWPIKFSYKTEKLQDESVKEDLNVILTQDPETDVVNILALRSSSWKRVIRAAAWMLRFRGYKRGTQLSTSLDCNEIRKAKMVLMRYIQRSLEEELCNSSGRFKRLSPMKDTEGVWRVGSRLKRFVPFTRDAKMPVLIPYCHRLTYLIMREMHEYCHAGQDGTHCRFRSEGYWAVKAGHLAKKVKKNCILCRKLNLEHLSQVMGDIPDSRLVNPVAWGYCQLDLFGPFSCRGDVNPRTTKKTWALVVEDANSGAVHLDIVQDYSANAVLSTLRRFGSLRGWPGIICSDPGSQSESASGKLQNWWDGMEKSLRTFAGVKNFKWEISPADSLWRQGKAERCISIVKRLIRCSVGNTRVSPVELQTALMEISNICNERPLGLSKPRDDGSYVLLTPNQLLMGRSHNILPDDAVLIEDMPITSRYRLVRHITSSFWDRWSKEVTPGLVFQQKWYRKKRDMVPGDLVMICESTKMKAKYRLGIVEEVKKSRDEVVRTATVKYSVVGKEGVHFENGRVSTVRVIRSVQRLILIMSVDDQKNPLRVEEDDVAVMVLDER